MGSHRPPVPLCSSRVGDEWIDLGTSCRSQSASPGPLIAGLASAAAGLAMTKLFPKAKADFDRAHVYSKSKEAARKRDIDMQIIGDDYTRGAEISLTSEKYLKELIRLGSGGRQQVSNRAKKIQFFIVRGGGEGFLPAFLANDTAGDFAVDGSTTDGKKNRTRFDMNDMLAVFDPQGKLIGAALLQRPISIPGTWSEWAANEVYNAWNVKEVSIYRNANFSIPYLGLVVDDGKKGVGWVDMHKQEATNGCIFIVDENTPDLDSTALPDFEPKLIVDILASIGKRADQVKGMIRLGVLRVVDIK